MLKRKTHCFFVIQIYTCIFSIHMVDKEPFLTMFLFNLLINILYLSCLYMYLPIKTTDKSLSSISSSKYLAGNQSSSVCHQRISEHLKHKALNCNLTIRGKFLRSGLSLLCLNSSGLPSLSLNSSGLPSQCLNSKAKPIKSL